MVPYIFLCNDRTEISLYCEKCVFRLMTYKTLLERPVCYILSSRLKSNQIDSFLSAKLFFTNACNDNIFKLLFSIICIITITSQIK